MWRGDSEFTNLTTWIHFSYKKSSLKILRQPIYKWKVLSLKQDTNAFFFAVTFSFGAHFHVHALVTKQCYKFQRAHRCSRCNEEQRFKSVWMVWVTFPSNSEGSTVSKAFWPWPPTEIQYTLQGMVYFAGMCNTNWNTKLIKIVLWSTTFQLFDPIWETKGNFFKGNVVILKYWRSTLISHYVI